MPTIANNHTSAVRASASMLPSPSEFWFKQLQRERTEATQDFIRAELSVIDTSVNLARSYYLAGRRRRGNKAKARAIIAIETVRLFTDSSMVLSRRVKVEFLSRCYELEQKLQILWPKSGNHQSSLLKKFMNTQGHPPVRFTQKIAHGSHTAERGATTTFQDSWNLRQG